MLSPNCRPAPMDEVTAVSQELYDGMARLATDPDFDKLPYLLVGAVNTLEWTVYADDLKIRVRKDVPYGDREALLADEHPTYLFCQGREAKDNVTFELRTYKDSSGAEFTAIDEVQSVTECAIHLADFLKRIGPTVDDVEKFLYEAVIDTKEKGVVGNIDLRNVGEKHISVVMDTMWHTPEHETFKNHEGLNLMVHGFPHLNFSTLHTTEEAVWQPANTMAHYADAYGYEADLPLQSRDIATGALRTLLSPKGPLLSNGLRSISGRGLDVAYSSLTRGRLHEAHEIGRELLALVQADLAALKTGSDDAAAEPNKSAVA